MLEQEISSEVALSIQQVGAILQLDPSFLAQDGSVDFAHQPVLLLKSKAGGEEVLGNCFQHVASGMSANVVNHSRAVKRWAAGLEKRRRV